MRLSLTLLALGACTPTGGFIDEDGDGFSFEQECDDTNPGIHPEAVDMAGDGIDANCSGADGMDSVVITQLTASLTSIGGDDESGGWFTTTCDATGDGADDLIYTVPRGDDSGIFVAGSPVQPGILPARGTASIQVELAFLQQMGCADFNADGRDDLMAIHSGTLGNTFVVWLQPEGGFSGQMAVGDGTSYPLDETTDRFYARYGEYDQEPGTDVVLYTLSTSGERHYRLLSGGTEATAIDDSLPSFSVGNLENADPPLRVQLDDDPALETVICLSGGCLLLKDYPWDGSPVSDYEIGEIATAGVAANNAHVGDFDGDGDADDLLLHPDRGGIGVYLNPAEQLSSTGVLAPDHYIDERFSGMYVVADMDGDGVQDIALSSPRVEDQTLTLYSLAQTVEDSLDGAAMLQLDHNPRNVASAHGGDFDGDGISDIAFAAFDNERSGQLGIYLSSAAP